VLGEEKYIIAHALALFTILNHVLFYPRSIAVEHLGWLTMALIAFAIALAVGSARFRMPRIILAQGHGAERVLAKHRSHRNPCCIGPAELLAANSFLAGSTLL
jgi:hypothetical protein